MTFKQQIIQSITNGLAMGIGIGLLTIIFVLIIMVIEKTCP